MEQHDELALRRAERGGRRARRAARGRRRTGGIGVYVLAVSVLFAIVAIAFGAGWLVGKIIL